MVHRIKRVESTLSIDYLRRVGNLQVCELRCGVSRKLASAISFSAGKHVRKNKKQRSSASRGSAVVTVVVPELISEHFSATQDAKAVVGNTLEAEATRVSVMADEFL